MDPAKFLTADYETGGLDPRICPPLSMAVVSADVSFRELDGFALRIRPPTNTVIAVPVPPDQRNDPTLFNPKIEHYLDLTTGEQHAQHPADFYIIQAPAARINGFVKIENDAWVMSSIDEWMTNSQTLDAAQRTLRTWLRQQFQSRRPVVAAHNAGFDRSFCKQWMPELYADLHAHWICTMLWYAKVLGKRKGTKLSDLCLAAGRTQTAAHEALSDARDVLTALSWLSANHPALLQTVIK